MRLVAVLHRPCVLLCKRARTPLQVPLVLRSEPRFLRRELLCNLRLRSRARRLRGCMSMRELLGCKCRGSARVLELRGRDLGALLASLAHLCKATSGLLLCALQLHCNELLREPQLLCGLSLRILQLPSGLSLRALLYVLQGALVRVSSLLELLVQNDELVSEQLTSRIEVRSRELELLLLLLRLSSVVLVQLLFEPLSSRVELPKALLGLGARATGHRAGRSDSAGGPRQSRRHPVS